MDTKILFNCPENETVYECLSRRIDYFDDILSRKLDTSEIIHKAEQKGCETSPCPNTLMIQRMQYLQCAYKNVLSTNVFEQQVKFNNCCINAINQISMVGVRLVNNFQILMKWK